MFRFTIRDLLGLIVVVAVALALIAIGQSGHVATLEGNACSVAAAIIILVGVTRIYRHTQARL
jgi:hypothetical protein